MEFDSIAMIETNGLVSAIAALETMLKLGEVNFLKKEIISNGQVTVFISGNAPNLKRVLQASEIAANNVGVVISSSIIENPSKEIMDLILEDKKVTAKPRKSKKKSADINHEKIDTLFDDIFEDAILKESTKIKYDNEIIIEEQKLAIHENVLDDDDSDISSTENNILDEDILIETEIEEVAEIEEKSENVINEGLTLDDEAQNDIDTIEEINLESSEELLNSEEEVLEEETLDKETPKEETSEVKEKINTENNLDLPAEEESKEDNNNLGNLSDLERLREEAKLEIEKENTSKTEHEEKVITPELNLDNEYSKMNVHELRKLARGNPNFPIKGREISKANRGILINYLNNIK